MTWTIEPHGDGYALYSGRDDMHHGMNLVYLSEPDWQREKTKALIEAAPELLKACERLVKIMEMLNEHDMPSCKFAKEAIKKARGEE